MKSIFIFSLLIIINNFLFAQYNREEKLQQLKNKTDVKVIEIEKDILKLEYPDGKVMYENIGEYIPSSHKNITYSPTYDSTIIDLNTIDTTLFYPKYSFSQEVKVGTVNPRAPLVADINNNNLPEIYGVMKDYSSGYSDVLVMEMNSKGIFNSVYSYDSTSSSNNSLVYDIDKDGWEELFLYRFPSDINYPGQSYLFFKKQSDSLLATELSFVFYPFPEENGPQLNKNTFGDWDGDKFTDQIFINNGWSINVYEYNPLINNFDSVFYYDLLLYDIYFGGFVIGDFNQNGKTEFFSGSTNGTILMIENCGNNCYSLKWQGKVETNNAYLYASTNDLDSNGKPEVWIGGYHFQDGIGITRVTIFESDGRNNYVAVGKIDIIGAFNFYAKNMQVLDVDKDGKEEVMMCIENHVIILKFNGSVNHQTYEVFYIKRNDLAISGRYSMFYGATMYDINNDGKEDIIIHLDEIIPNVGIRLFSFIYKADFTVDINESEPIIEKFHLYQNYPNPFNPSTNIKFEIPEHSKILVKVYDILGKEIITLINKELSPGNYTIEWEGKDSNGKSLPSGVYLIKLNAINTKINYVKTLKAVLIK